MTTRKTAYPDAATTIAIASELTVTAKAVLERLSAKADAGKKLLVAEDLLRIAQAARLISLRVVTLVCERAHELAVSVESSSGSMDTGLKEALRTLMGAVHSYVAGVAGGRIPCGFSLHGPYSELMRYLPEASVALRQEFFLPISPSYGANSPNYNEGRFIAEVARYIDEFRQALRRHEARSDLDSINTMRTTFVTMETKNPPANFRMLLSLGISFMDVAMRAGGKIAADNEPLLDRLERELSGVVKGELDVDEGTISWLMNVVGQASQFSARVRVFQEAYELPRLIEEGQAVTVNDESVTAMAKALESAQKTWEAALVPGGDHAAAKSACFALVAVSNVMGDYALKTMALAVGSLADGIVDQRLAADPDVALFGASIIVAMEERLGRLNVDPRGSRAAADACRERVRAVLSGKRPGDLPREHANQGGHVQSILDELNNDLSTVEQLIDQCLRGGAKEVKREEVDKLFTVVKSALSFVNMADGAAYATRVADYVDQIMSGLIAGQQPSDAQRRILAESVMILHRFTSLAGADSAQAEAALARGQALFDAGSEPQPEALAPQQGPLDVCSDDDLGPIFFEEAKGVIAEQILPGLARLRSNPGDEETMLEVRRSFHTLKGSARMVGLNHLGTVGQHTEYALNLYRDNRNLRPSAELFDWLEQAAQLFSASIALLEQGQGAPVDAAPFEAVYNYLQDNGSFVRVDLGAVGAPGGATELSQAAEELADVLDAQPATEAISASVHIPETGTVILPSAQVLASSRVEAASAEAIASSTPVSDQVDVVIDSDATSAMPADLAAEAAPADAATGDATIDETVVLPVLESVVEAPWDLAPAHREGPSQEPAASTSLLAVDLDVSEAVSADPAPQPSEPRGSPEPPPLPAAEPVQALPAAADDDLEWLDEPPPLPVLASPPARVVAVAEPEAAQESVFESVSETPAESSGEVIVGSVSIPTPMYNAFVKEAREFYRSLSETVRLALDGRRSGVDFESMRMAHSLAGMGRTTGLSAVTHLAEKVEDWVKVNQDRQLHVCEVSRAAINDALEALEAMILGIEDRIEPVVEDTIVQRLCEVIEADERRIAMAQDVRPEVSASVMERMTDEDVGVTDAGLVPATAQPGAAADGDAAQGGSQAAAVLSHDIQDEGEVAKAPEMFRLEHAIENADEAVTVEPLGAGQDDTPAVGIDFSHEGQAQQLEPEAVDHANGPSEVVESLENVVIDEVEQAQAGPDREGEAGQAAAPGEGAADRDHALDLGPDLGFGDARVGPRGQQRPAGDTEAEGAGASPAQVDILSESLFADQVVPPTVQTSMGTLAVPLFEHPAASSRAEPASVTTGLDWLAIVSEREDDLDEQMFEIFQEEAAQRFEEIDAALASLQLDLADKRLTNLLKRAVHTLKGSANTAGGRKLGAIFHHLEDLMEATPVLDAPVLSELQSGVDAAFAAFNAMRGGRSVESAIRRGVRASAQADGAGEAAEIAQSSQVAEPAAGGFADMGSDSNVEPQSDVGAEEGHAASASPAPAETAAKSAPSGAAAAAKKKIAEEENQLRVSTSRLDKMVKAVGEVNIARSRMGMNLGISKLSLNGLTASLERMNGLVRQVELAAERQMSAGDQNRGQSSAFDALQMDRFTQLQELTRRLAEAQDDVMTQQATALAANREMEEALASQYLLITNLSADMDQIRQVRVSSIVPALKRVVRAACRDTDKQGEIYFDADVEIDRGILSKVMGSLEHILRNAVAHGIEAPAERIALGKDATGTLEFRAYQDGGEVVIEVRDDGRGLDVQRIRASAVRKGLIKEGATLSENQVRELIFEPGFSTVVDVSDIAGRGVGLDVVRSDVSAMGGRVIVTSTPGAGTTFVLRVPATLTVIAGAAVTTNAHMYVVPVSFIDRMIRVNANELDGAYKSRKLLVQDAQGHTEEYEFWGMWQLAGAKVWEGSPQPRNSVLLMRNERVAVHIDDIRPASDFVFRPLGPQVVNSSGLIGSTIHSTGNAALVLDPARVARTLRAQKRAAVQPATDLSKQRKAPLVLVVDDSTTVRKVTARLLKKEGLRHAEAENGMKCLELLQQERPDVILMDIEMPVMNGYDAAQAIRATAETADIPIIMITSRVGDAHRQRALSLGVNEYLGKPYNEGDLLELINKFIAPRMVANG